MIGEGVGLNDKRGTRLAEIAGNRRRDEIASAHSIAAFAVDVGQGGVHEAAQIRIGPISFGGQARLAAAFLGEAGPPGVGNPDWNRPQARAAQRGAPHPFCAPASISTARDAEKRKSGFFCRWRINFVRFSRN